MDLMQIRRNMMGVIASMAGAGNSNIETGSFTADTSDSLTITVTKLHSKIYIYHSTITKDTDLTNAPYGTNKRVALFADNDTGMILQSMLNYAGTAYGGDYTKMGTAGTTDSNIVEFSASQISFTKMRFAGANRSFIDGATYNWIAL